MSNSPQQSFRSLLLLGSLFVAIGALIFLMAVDVIHVPDEDIYAPRWVLAAVGVAFALAGVMVTLNGLKSGFGDHPVFKWAYNALLVLFMIIFVIPFHWVAFGPGDRSFNSSTSVGAVSVSQGGGGELGGRLAFGLGAILVDLLILYMIYRVIQGKDLSKGG